MLSATEQLTGLINNNNRYDIPYAELEALQTSAVNERFQQRRAEIRLLGHRAGQAGIESVESLDAIVPLLFPHTVYKSYPDAFLLNARWDKLAKWLDTTSTYRIPIPSADAFDSIDSWLADLETQGFYVNCSSGTTGKSAMMLSSRADLDWCLTEAVQAYTWGSGVRACNDRRIFGLAPVALTPRNQITGEAYYRALQTADSEPFRYPVPPITVGSLTSMIVLRKRIADGTATPADIQHYETTSATRQRQMDDAIDLAADAIIEARGERLHVTGLWSGLYNVARRVRDRGFNASDFNPENSIYVGGGLKRAVLPDDYREFVYGTFNIQPERNYQNYSMQELQSGMPRCREGNRYHLPPWVVPLILDKSGDALLPRQAGEYEGRAAFFDLSLDGRWGGVISGDRVSIDYNPCRCGARGPSIRDDIVRYADLEGDDKIGCAGTVDAYIRGVS